MPLRDFTCADCGNKFESFVKRDPVLLREVGTECPACQSSNVASHVSAPGGYHMNSGSASTRPRGAGSFKKGKK